MFVLPQFWYGFDSAFGGQPLYDSWLYQLYNILFTAFPIMWFATFDQEFLKDELLKDPRHFKIGIKSNKFLNADRFRPELRKVSFLEMDPLRHLPDAHATDNRVPLARGQ